MKRWISGSTALSGLVALLFAGQSALAADRQSNVYFDNKSDAFVWVTVYATRAGCHTYVTRCQVGEAYGAWCVAQESAFTATTSQSRLRALD